MNAEQHDAGEIVRVKYRACGRVQGVGFRHYLKTAAAARAVRGWAKNVRDGSLLVLLEGDGDKVGEMLALLKEGPTAAHVVSVTELVDDDETENITGFSI